MNDSTAIESDDCCRYLALMYEYYFTPIKTEGITAMNVVFHSDSQEDAQEILLNACILYIEPDQEVLRSLSRSGKMEYLLNLCQDRMIGYATDHNWSLTSFEAAYSTIVKKQYLFREHWKQAVFSPDRQIKAQIYFEHDYLSSGTFVDFTDKNNQPLRRVQFTPSGWSVLCDCVGFIKWNDNSTVKINRVYVPRAGRDAETNIRDYWLIGCNGDVAFIKPQADDSDPQAMFALGTMLYEGRVVLMDKEKGLLLIQKSADLGYRHAQNWIRTHQINKK